MLLSTVLVLTLSIASALDTSYDGYKVYTIIPATQEQFTILRQLEQDESGLDFWSDLTTVGKAVDIMVPNATQNEFEAHMQLHGFNFNVMIEDVQKLIELETQQQTEAKSRASTRWIQFDQYYSHNQINEYLAFLAATYPNLVTLEDSGPSYEGRALIVAKISANPSAQNPIVLIDGGIHAREWISPASVLYIINQLVENATNSYLLENLDWYILPVLNPDGYEFSRTSTRLWRKTRSPGLLCVGVDGNRNFDYFWGTVGASALQCSETFRGSSPNSEVETVNFINFASQYSSRIKLYLSYHSYGNYLLYPWGYISSAPSNGNELQTLGNAAAAAIQANSGRSYTVGVSSVTLYATSGSSVDYVYGALGVPLAYTVELPGEGVGFIWPPAQILEVARETWESIVVFGGYVSRLYGKH